MKNFKYLPFFLAVSFLSLAFTAHAAANIYAQVDDTQVFPQTWRYNQQLGNGLSGEIDSLTIRAASAAGLELFADIRMYTDEFYTNPAGTVFGCNSGTPNTSGEVAFDYSCRNAVFDPALYYKIDIFSAGEAHRFVLLGSLPGVDNNLWGGGWLDGDALYYDSGFIVLHRQDIYFLFNRDTEPVIYESDFSSDPQWNTDQPENFYWDESAEAFHARTQNIEPEQVPNRYAYAETVLDPNEAFLLEWDVLPIEFQFMSQFAFGLFDAALSLETSHIAGAFYGGGFHDFRGRQVYSTGGTRFHVETRTNLSLGGGSFSLQSEPKAGVWYHFSMNYNPVNNNAVLVIKERDTGEYFLGVSAHLFFDEPFFPDTSNLGVSNYPWQRDEHASSSFAAYIDNIELRGLPREGLEPPAPPAAECCSSVAFIPGLQASRLELGDNRLWEPLNAGDVAALYLNDAGEPETPGITAAEIIDEALFETQGFNIYKNFITFMDKLVTDDAIEEWKPYPYDWRFSVEAIAEELYRDISQLAERSPTGTVTILAHSNGGLIAKELIDRFTADGNTAAVDKLILVAAPQLGTPKAIAGLLHGDRQEIPPKLGIILPKNLARGLAENMPSAYGLLPSEKYFSEVFDPVIEFEDDVSEIYDFQSFYGNAIETREELVSFLLGDDGARSEPADGDTDAPNVLDELMLAKAAQTQARQDNWAPSDSVRVIQIAGWGLDTIRGIRYDDCDIPFCPDTLSNLDRELLLAHDGDGTVVIPSAVAMENTETYYVNLQKHNRELLLARRNRDHADILEVEPVMDLLFRLFTDEVIGINKIITSEKPLVEDKNKKLRFRIHSPVSLDLYSEDGELHTGRVENINHTSDLERVEQKIPNSYYFEFGETKYAGAGTVTTTTVELIGQNTGTFIFEIDEVLGDDVVASIAFSDIPVLAGARVTTNVRRVASSTVLAMDMNADGETDAIIRPGAGITVEELIGILRGMVASFNLDAKAEKRILQDIDKLEKAFEKEYKHEKKEKRKTEKALEKLEGVIKKLQKKEQLSGEDAQGLLYIIEQIKVGVVG